MVPMADKGETTMRSKVDWTHRWPELAVAVVCLSFALSMSAQVQTRTTTASATPTVDNHVESGEVVTVSGNDLVVKMSDGTIRHVANVPESARVLVDGQELGIHDLKPGMKLQRTITTTTTPKTITTVQSVTGKVWFISPPNSVILTLADGKNQQFKIPNNQKFNVDGQMVDAWGLKKGMNISATKVVEVPVTVVSQSRTITGEMPPPPPPPPADVPILVVEEEVVVPVEVAQAAPPAELPHTGSELPLIGLLGLLSLASSLGLRTARRNR
jgi:LPXTG-motif cell wall-anchored protein